MCDENYFSGPSYVTDKSFSGLNLLFFFFTKTIWWVHKMISRDSLPPDCSKSGGRMSWLHLQLPVWGLAVLCQCFPCFVHLLWGSGVQGLAYSRLEETTGWLTDYGPLPPSLCQKKKNLLFPHQDPSCVSVGLTPCVAQFAACSYSVGWYLLLDGTLQFMNLQEKGGKRWDQSVKTNTSLLIDWAC